MQRNDLLTEFHMDIAASIQAVTEEIVLKLTKNPLQRIIIKKLMFSRRCRA